MNIQFIRLPYLGRRYVALQHVCRTTPAYALWQLCCLGAMLGFVLLWPAKRMVTLLLCCWFPPTAASFANGQDVPFLLLWAAVAAYLVHGRKDFSAGLVLSLCAAKFHLLLFLPCAGDRSSSVEAGFRNVRRMQRVGRGVFSRWRAELASGALPRTGESIGSSRLCAVRCSPPWSHWGSRAPRSESWSPSSP